VRAFFFVEVSLSMVPLPSRCRYDATQRRLTTAGIDNLEAGLIRCSGPSDSNSAGVEAYRRYILRHGATMRDGLD
jgi:hypothetical protein